MMTFESDLAPLSNVTVIPTGTPDLLDVWYAENVEMSNDWAWYFEEVYSEYQDGEV